MNATRAEIEQAIVNTVSYVDAFDYPLTPAEIHRYLVGLSLPQARLTEFLHSSAIVPRRLSQLGDYYMLPGREVISQMRQDRRAVSERLWPGAVKYGRSMARMPFVRMVAVTGSLAVNNVGSKEDIDYFIITADDHLWVCRAFVILIVRAAAMRGYDLCPNFFLAESALHLTEQNIYIAHEMTQMVPLYGLETYKRLRAANPWVQEILPNAIGAPPSPAGAHGALLPTGKFSTRGLMETVLHTRPGLSLDRWEMSRKIKKFRESQYPWKEAEFSAKRCKGHFNLHQHAAIQAYERLVNSQTPVVEPFELETPVRASI